MNRLQALHDAGVSIWLDTLSRDLLEEGEFARLVDEYAVTGATSNPTIFAKAISYSDVLYVERLIAPGVINTMPDKTLHAFADHGSVGRALAADVDAAAGVISVAAAEGLDLDAITRELEREGLSAFCDSYGELLSCMESKLGSLVG
jgi:transaldolase